MQAAPGAFIECTITLILNGKKTIHGPERSEANFSCNALQLKPAPPPPKPNPFPLALL